MARNAPLTVLSGESEESWGSKTGIPGPSPFAISSTWWSQQSWAAAWDSLPQVLQGELFASKKVWKLLVKRKTALGKCWSPLPRTVTLPSLCQLHPSLLASKIQLRASASEYLPNSSCLTFLLFCRFYLVLGRELNIVATEQFKNHH